MNTKKAIRVVTAILISLVAVKLIAILILLSFPLSGSAPPLLEFVIDRCTNYPNFYILFDLPFPILYSYWRIKKSMVGDAAFWGIFFSILHIPLGFVMFLFAITHIF